MKPKLLVHACCAPDAFYVVGLLREEYEPTLFFSNSNIHPAEEYSRRLEDARRVAGLLAVPFIEDAYEPEKWLRAVDRFKDEPEKGRRCDICYALRLHRTAATAARLGFQAYATVMTVSPWKKADVINRIGRMSAAAFGLDFLESNFKKKDGFKKSVELSRGLGLYRQGYCGCVYSREAASRKRP